MEIEFKNKTIYFSGFLDESTNLEKLKTALNTAIKELKSGYLKVNFSAVSMANSVGILKWLKAIDNLNLQLCYSQAPKWLVSQINMIPQFMKNKAVIESFEVPFYSEENDKEISKLFVVGKDIKIQSESYSEHDFPSIEDGGFTYMIDVLPKNYFRFITENYDAFKEYFKGN